MLLLFATVFVIYVFSVIIYMKEILNDVASFKVTPKIRDFTRKWRKVHASSDRLDEDMETRFTNIMSSESVEVDCCYGGRNQKHFYLFSDLTVLCFNCMVDECQLDRMHRLDCITVLNENSDPILRALNCVDLL